MLHLLILLVATTKPNNINIRPNNELNSKVSPKKLMPRINPTIGIRNVTMEVLAAPAELMSLNQMIKASAVLKTARHKTALIEI